MSSSLFQACFTVAVLTTLTAPHLQAQTTKNDQRRHDYPQIYAVLDLAEGSPAELHALALLRVGSHAAIHDKQWREDLLEDAFEVGGQAQLPSPVISVLLPNGSISAAQVARMMRIMAMDAGVDRLTLQSRAVRSLAPLNFEKALSLFQRIFLSKLEPAPCSASSVPDTEQYFQTAAELARLAPAKMREGIVISALSSISSATQIPPALRLLNASGMNAREQQRSLLAAANAVEGLPHDSRAWAAGLEGVNQIMGEWIKVSAPDGQPMLLAIWRSYLVAGSAGSVCPEAVDPKNQYAIWAKEGIDAFNGHIGNFSNIPAISDEDRKITKIELGITENQLEQSARIKDLQKAWWNLMFGQGSTGLSDKQKSTVEWKTQFSLYLNQVEELNGSDIADGQDLLKEKAERISAAIAAAPKNSPEFQQALHRYFGLMKITTTLPEAVWQWYATVHGWIDACSALGISRFELLAELDHSDNLWLKLLSKIDLL